MKTAIMMVVLLFCGVLLGQAADEQPLLDARVDVVVKPGAWNYTITNNDRRETSGVIAGFEVTGLSESAKATRSPKGWKPEKNPGAVSWIADPGYEIRVGKSLSGFQIGGATGNSSNVRYTVSALVMKNGVEQPGRATWGNTLGPK